MAKSKKQHEEPESEAAIMERMNKALNKMLSTPPETHKDMVERRRTGLPRRGARKQDKQPQ